MDVDLDKLYDDAKELGDRVLEIMQEYSPLVGATALWSLAGSLIGQQQGQDVEVLVSNFTKNMRDVAYQYRENLKKNPCTHGDKDEDC